MQEVTVWTAVNLWCDGAPKKTGSLKGVKSEIIEPQSRGEKLYWS